MEKILWEDRVLNEYVLRNSEQRGGTTGKYMKKNYFFRLIMRGDSLLRTATELKVRGKRRRTLQM